MRNRHNLPPIRVLPPAPYRPTWPVQWGDLRRTLECGATGRRVSYGH